MSVLFYAIRPCNDLDTIAANSRKQTVLHLFLDAALKPPVPESDLQGAVPRFAPKLPGDCFMPVRSPPSKRAVDKSNAQTLNGSV